MEALSNQLFTWVTFAYMASAIAYLCMSVFKVQWPGRLGSWVAWVALGGHTLAIVLRWVGSYEKGYGHAPFSNLFESLVFFGWALCLVYLIIELRTGFKKAGVFAMPLVFAAMLYALGQDSAIKPLVPALKSNWLIAHVITCFLGYAGFGISAALSLLYLFGGGELSKPRTRAVLDNLIYQSVVVGFLLLSAGIITGAIWADVAWGRYWGWDPKEVWSLITWLVYAAMLHMRFFKGWQGKTMAIFSLVGFGCVLFTYFGVNFWLSGLHAYVD